MGLGALTLASRAAGIRITEASAGHLAILRDGLCREEPTLKPKGSTQSAAAATFHSSFVPLRRAAPNFRAPARPASLDGIVRRADAISRHDCANESPSQCMASPLNETSWSGKLISWAGIVQQYSHRLWERWKQTRTARAGCLNSRPFSRIGEKACPGPLNGGAPLSVVSLGGQRYQGRCRLNSWLRRDAK